MSIPRVSIVHTGIANIASVSAAFVRMGAEVDVIESGRRVLDDPCVVLPGVGSFGAGMESLRTSGLVDAIGDRIDAGRPALAICLGMQLLCEASGESPGVRGLGIVPGMLTPFPEGVRRTQFGWNRVEPDIESSALAPGYAYFAHSFRLTTAPDGWNAAWTESGGRFVAAIERENVLACQFHPELSGAWGARVLDRWITRVTEGAPC